MQVFTCISQGGPASGTVHPPGWLVTADGAVIGDISTHGPVDEAGRVEIGYGLAAPSRRVLEKAGFTYVGLDEGEALYQRP
jgi:RimJ/RimL family protein N-acetyltransferase